MTEFISRKYGNEGYEIIIKTDSHEHYKAAEGFARRMIDHEKPMTNGDRIRAMSDEELSDFLCGIAYAGSEKWSAPFMREFCDKCPTVECVVTETGQKMNFYECDFKDGKCPHGSDISWWLKQPVEVE